MQFSNLKLSFFLNGNAEASIISNNQQLKINNFRKLSFI